MVLRFNKILWGLLIGSSMSAQPNENLTQFLSKVGSGASVSLCVVDLKTNATVMTHQPTLQLTPASVTKVITTASAFEKLGPDFHFQTQVLASGNVENGICEGDLIVVGGGDPTLGASQFEAQRPDRVLTKITDAISAKGITAFKGKMIVNTSFFSKLPYPAGRLWDDLGNYFGGCPSSLSYRENTFSLYLNSPAQKEALCTFETTDPVLKDIRFNCKVVASGSRDSAYIYGVPQMNEWVVQGSMPVSRQHFRVKGALPNPPMQFANELLDALKKKGIAIDGDIELIDIPIDGSKCTSVCVIESPPLSDIIKIINTYSHNLMADHVWLTLGMPLSSARSPWDVSAKVVKQCWIDKKVSGANDCQLYDGSGLSLLTSVSSQSVTGVLQQMYQSKDFQKFKSTLAVGGQTGTLQNLWKDDATRGRVIAKSGSMTGVVAYAGYLTTAAGRECAFTVIVNHSTLTGGEVRKAIERLVSDIIVNL